MEHWSKRALGSPKLRILAVCAAVSMLVISVAVARGLRARSQSKVARDALVEQMEKAPVFPIRIQQDDDAPVRIVEATVQEISGSDYEKLTSEKSNHLLVVSAPQVKMVNVSGKTVQQVMLVVNDASTQQSQGIVMKNLSVESGSTYTISPASFVKSETLTAVDQHGTVTSSLKPPMKSKKFWLPFADKSQIQVRVGIGFQDGTTWFNRDQRRGN